MGLGLWQSREPHSPGLVQAYTRSPSGWHRRRVEGRMPDDDRPVWRLQTGEVRSHLTDCQRMPDRREFDGPWELSKR
jgi:hypothetical protein